MTSTMQAAPPSPPTRTGWGGLPGRLLRGAATDPAWARPALLALLVATGVLYVWGLGASGWANAYYSAAVQAGATSWKAFLFGSSDAANAITVDKAPGALWPMVLAARVFGVNSWSILVPQALMGVATVGVLHAAVRCRFPAWAALLSGAALALTPVAALMFRFNNPDAMLVLLLTLGAYGLLRAQETASTRWLMFAAACVGTGFLAKMLQAFLVVPVFAMVYLVTAPAPVRRRIWQLLAAGGRCWCRPGGGSRWSRWCPPRPGPTSAGRSTTPSWSWRWATTGSGASTGTRPAASATSTRTPGGAAWSGP